MAIPWVEPGWCEIGWVEQIEVGTVTLVLGEAVTAATNFGDPGALETLFHANPGPYADEVIMALQLSSGMYLFGKKMPSRAIQSDAIGTEASLLSISDLPIASAPLANDLISNIGASEIPRVTVTFNNADRGWSKRLAREPILLRGASLWNFYGGVNLRLVFLGQVTRVRLHGFVCEVEIGEP